MSAADMQYISLNELQIRKLKQAVLGLNDKDTLLDCLDFFELSRGKFAEQLDVSEATFSRWLSEDRVPLMVTQICALLIRLERLREDFIDLKKKCEDLKIVAKKDGFVVCRFRPNEDGIEIGSIVAETPGFDGARLVVASERALRLALEAVPYLNEYSEKFEDDHRSYSEHIDAHSAKIEDLNDFVNDLEKWKTRHKPILTIDDL